MSDDFKNRGTNFCLENAILTFEGRKLRAIDFDDVYYSVEDGLGESKHVFLHGNDLYKRLAEKQHFTIAETGFGTGLNFLAVMQLVKEIRNLGIQKYLQVDYISFESRPLTLDILKKSHSAFPEIELLSSEFVAQLPPRWPGLHRRDFLGGNIRLHLIYGDAEKHLRSAEFSADAWFLDGFAPSKNPQLWTESLLLDVGRLTCDGGTFASFTAAQSVRKRLSNAGFQVEKREGFGKKKHMTIGVKLILNKLARPKISNDIKIGIIGGGIAGAAVSSGLILRGVVPKIIEANNKLASSASGNRLGIQAPRLSLDHSKLSYLSSNCLSRAAWVSDQAGSSFQRGVISLDWPEREAVRQAKFRQQTWPEELLKPLNADEVSVAAGVNMNLGGLMHEWGRVIDPKLLTEHLATGADVELGCEVNKISEKDNGINVSTSDGKSFVFDRLVLAGGAGMRMLNELFSIKGLPIESTAGRVSQVPNVPALAMLKTGISFGGYFTGSYQGFHELGASFERNGNLLLSAEANKKNFDRLPSEISTFFPDPALYGSRFSRRATLLDHAPALGKVRDNVFVFAALGARGLTLAPLLGDFLAAEILGTPALLDYNTRLLIDPGRFRMRASRL